MSLIGLLKKLPIDLGQAQLRGKTKGKLIALSFVKDSDGARRALDVGCREGIQSEWLKAKGYVVSSIDIEKSYKHCKIVDVNKKLPFKSNYFDLIWCSEVIEHLDNPAKSVAEFRRALKPGGEMVITTPNSRCWLYSLLRPFGITPEKMQNPGHKHFFGIKAARKIFPNAKIMGYFPYCLLKFKISSLVGLLSPTFVIYEKKSV